MDILCKTPSNAVSNYVRQDTKLSPTWYSCTELGEQPVGGRFNNKHL
jgi:hypothetical protein